MKVIVNSFSRTYRGVHFSATTEEGLDKMISRFIYEQSIFYHSSVYTYSCLARMLESGKVEFVQNFNNYSSKKVTVFENKQEFWKSI